MLKEFKKYLNIEIIVSIVSLILGIWIVLSPDKLIKLITYVIAISLIIYGVVGILYSFKGNMVVYCLGMPLGIISFLAGILILVNDSIIEVIIPMILGLLFMVGGVIKLKFAFILRDIKESYLSSLIFSFLLIICGIIMVFKPIMSAIAITKFIGYLMFIYAIFNVIDVIFLKYRTKEIQKYLDRVFNEIK